MYRCWIERPCFACIVDIRSSWPQHDYHTGWLFSRVVEVLCQRGRNASTNIDSFLLQRRRTAPTFSKSSSAFCFLINAEPFGACPVLPRIAKCDQCCSDNRVFVKFLFTTFTNRDFNNDDKESMAEAAMVAKKLMLMVICEVKGVAHQQSKIPQSASNLCPSWWRCLWVWGFDEDEDQSEGCLFQSWAEEWKLSCMERDEGRRGRVSANSRIRGKGK